MMMTGSVLVGGGIQCDVPDNVANAVANAEADAVANEAAIEAAIEAANAVVDEVLDDELQVIVLIKCFYTLSSPKMVTPSAPR